ncbi:YcxB family protein [Weizmannia sp. CD-2023]|uniref:YcxB family protein n=2 Tax=Heyndrickxia TaxID=2837504 RepID=UPI0005511F61|nr:YcxB family protein [Weizmannia sp. CD-2023]KGT37321.1 hypothetical protein P421_15965 [Heyndrickxia coagulans P38]MED4841958.1 YcxB family protein [Weizmannia sp. CD-2023]
MSSVKISYEMTDKDIFALLKDNFFFSPRVVRVRRICYVFVVLFCLIYSNYYLHSTIEDILMNIVLTLFIAFLFPPLWKLNLIRIAKAHIKKSNLANFKKRFEFVFQPDSESFLRINMESNSEERIMWKDVIRVHQDESHYFLYLSGNKAIILPKQHEISDEENERYHEIIDKFISNNGN